MIVNAGVTDSSNIPNMVLSATNPAYFGTEHNARINPHRIMNTLTVLVTGNPWSSNEAGNANAKYPR